jgi:endonuclease/exonuclease/phosphatase (EEP) superfamily protein YafD
MKKKNFLLALKISLRSLLAIILLMSLLGFLSSMNFVFDVCSHLRLQYLFFSLITMIVLLLIFRKKTLSLILSILIFIFNFFPIVSVIKINKYGLGKSISVGMITLTRQNKQYKSVIMEIAKTKPDILILQEIDDKWSSKLQVVKNSYPYVYEISRKDNYGMAIYSKVHITQIRRMNIGTYDIPAISAFCDVNGKVFEILSIHSTPSTSQKYFINTKSVYSALADYIVQNGDNIIVVSEMNVPQYASTYKNFISRSKMKDCFNIFNLSYSAKLPYLVRLPYDHIFITNSFILKGIEIGSSVGSEHFPIYVKVGLKK